MAGGGAAVSVAGVVAVVLAGAGAVPGVASVAALVEAAWGSPSGSRAWQPAASARRTVTAGRNFFLRMASLLRMGLGRCGNCDSPAKGYRPTPKSGNASGEEEVYRPGRNALRSNAICPEW